MSPQALHINKKLKFSLKNKNNNLKILRPISYISS